MEAQHDPEDRSMVQAQVQAQVQDSDSIPGDKNKLAENSEFVGGARRPLGNVEKTESIVDTHMNYCQPMKLI